MEIGKYSIGNWTVDGHGNHRAVVKVNEISDIVIAEIPWRRRDDNPEIKDVLVENEKGELVSRKVLLNTKEFGKIAFEAKNIGLYYIYYLPFNQPREYFVPETPYFVAGNNDFEKPIKGLDDNPILEKEASIEKNGRKAPAQLDYKENLDYPKAEFIQIEARTEFDSMYPMEVPVTEEEYNSVIKDKKDFLVFPEDRLNQIKMVETIPYKWFESGETFDFKGVVQPNEIYAFQIGVLALKDINNLQLKFSDFENNESEKLCSNDFHCINLGGNDYLGHSFTKTVNVPKSRVQALWVYVQIPENAKGEYIGKVKVFSDNSVEKDINISLKVQGEVLKDKGVGDLWRMSRLAWLDSSLGINNSVIPPYTNIEVENNVAKILNREIVFGENGLPVSVKSNNKEILESPLDFSVIINNQKESFSLINKEILIQEEGTYKVKYTLESDNLILTLIPCLEFEGSLNYNVSLQGKKSLKLDNVYLNMPIKNEIAKYFMGLGIRGGFAPDIAEWKWNDKDAANMAWTGTYDAGIQLKLNTETNQYYVNPPIPTEEYPKGWYNQNNGNFKAEKTEKSYNLYCESGSKELKANEVCNFDFRLMITPFKPLDNKHHFEDRIGKPGQCRTNIYHIHHACIENPYINYPFRTIDKLKAFSEKLKGFKDIKGNKIDIPSSFGDNLIGNTEVKEEWFSNEIIDFKINLYYTCRELTNHCYEIWALRSLGDEIYANAGMIYDAQGATLLKDGSGGGHPWAVEHCKYDYVPAWYCNLGEDHCQALSTKFVSRWMNYYVNGMDYIMKETGIDGLYLDGIGYDRETMKRIARVMASNSKDFRINYHSGNTYDYENWRSNVFNNTMEHLPYMTTLWIGEMFDYSRSSDYWFTEISGIPFGIYSEMLQYGVGGNKYRGMVYSMTGRQGNFYMPTLKFWDDFDLESKTMIGYWDDKPLVSTSKDKILATTFVGEKENIVSVGSWAENSNKISLKVDFEYKKVYAPQIDNFQDENMNIDINSIQVAPEEGIVLVFEKK